MKKWININNQQGFGGLIALFMVVVATLVIVSMLPLIGSVVNTIDFDEAWDIVGAEGYVCADSNGNWNISGDLGVGGDADIDGDLTVLGTISGSISGTTEIQVTIASENSHAIYKLQASHIVSGSQMEIAINAALQDGIGGEVLQYPGDYWTIGSIIVPGSTVYEASGWNTRILRRGAATGPTISASDCSNVTIKNFFIDGGSPSVSAYTEGVTFNGVTDSTISNMRIVDLSRVSVSGTKRAVGIHITNGANVDVLYNSIDEPGHAGIRFEKSIDCTAIGNHVSNGWTEGIAVSTFLAGAYTGEESTDITISVNHITNCGHGEGNIGGISVEDKATSGAGNPHQRISILDNNVRDCARGITLGKSSTTITRGDHIISRNIIENSSNSNGIGLEYYSNCTFESNEILNSSNTNITVNNSPDTILRGNSVTDAGNLGISMNNSPRSIIESNKVVDSADIGISIFGSGTGCAVNNNWIKALSGFDCIRVIGTASDGEMNDNYLLALGNGDGIEIDQSADRWNVSGNTIINTDIAGAPFGKGIYIDVDDSFIEGNMIYGMTGGSEFYYGINLETNSNDVVVQNNDVRNSYTNKSIYNEGSDNILLSNPGFVTVNSGSSTGTGIQQELNHGLDVIPVQTDIDLTMFASGTFSAYSSQVPTSTKIYITAPLGVDYGWRVDTED